MQACLCTHPSGSFPPSHWPLQLSQHAEFQCSWKKQEETVSGCLLDHIQPFQYWRGECYVLLSPTMLRISVLP